ncbi:hypothetical protein ACFL5Z_18635 [Planctomycetota bacterium]
MKCTQKDEKLRRIRNRASYVLFQELYEFLSKNPCVADILRKFYDILDAKKGFGSRRNAECAAESLQWVLRDNGEVDNGPRKQKRPDEQK